MPDYLLKRLQKVQNAAASFIVGKFTEVSGVTVLGWLPVKERIGYSIGKISSQALRDNKWPRYLPLQVKQTTRVLCSGSKGGLELEHSKFEDSFQFNATKVFNNIPNHIKLMNFKNIKINFKNILLAQAKTRTEPGANLQ